MAVDEFGGKPFAPDAGCYLVAIYCGLQFLWGLMKLPYHFNLSKAIGLPHAFTPHPDAKAGGQCPMMMSPIMRTKAWQKSPPMWIGFHTVFAALMELVFALTLIATLPLEAGRWILATLFVFQLPFFAMFFQNLGSLPSSQASSLNIFAVVATTVLLGILFNGDPHSPNSVPFYVLIGLWQIPTFIDLAVCCGVGRNPCGETEPSDFDTSDTPTTERTPIAAGLPAGTGSPRVDPVTEPLAEPDFDEASGGRTP